MKRSVSNHAINEIEKKGNKTRPKERERQGEKQQYRKRGQKASARAKENNVINDDL